MELETAIKKIREALGVEEEDAIKIIEKAQAGNEITEKITLDNWLSERFLKNCVLIDESGYSKMCVDALKILSMTAATDYGSSRQRDMGQLWADMTRGYLGELAFILFLKKRWNIIAELDHEKGKLEDFLPMDIHRVSDRAPKLKIGIKTTKWNGIWVDIPGDQFNHSDIHVLVKVGAGRDHLFSFFKNLSVFKDKVLKRGVEVGSLSQEESKELYDKLPSFNPIPAYICGFIRSTNIYPTLSYKGKKGRKNYTITEWNGPISSGDLEKIKILEEVGGKISFEGIGDFAHDSGYLFNTGNLLWKDKDWEKVCKEL